MNVYQKLNAARKKFHQQELKKSGHNKFANYYYFELGDFVIPALNIFEEIGITSVISFEGDIATMSIINNEKPDERITIFSPMSEASLKGCHPVQNLGAVQTYIRRYLWVAALEIVEHDALDATTGGTPVEEKAKKVEKKEEVKPEVKEEPSQDFPLFVEKMIEWGEESSNKEDLTSLWKNNQGTIDKLKATDAALFAKLTAAFSEIKTKFTE
jgi:hypothetical protein